MDHIEDYHSIWRHPVKSYIKDTPDFLRNIEEITILSGENFFTLDVASSYTNIPLEESLDIMEEEFFPKTKCGIPIKYLRKLLELILKCNNFKFDRKHFLQINGTAMGTRVAPTYAKWHILKKSISIHIILDLENGSGSLMISGEFSKEIKIPSRNLILKSIPFILLSPLVENFQKQKWIS